MMRAAPRRFECTDPSIELFAGRYRIERFVGGGMAEVYRAWDQERHRHVALKVYAGHEVRGVATARFLREIDTMSQLDHPHAVPVIDSGAYAGGLYYVMPWIEAGSLRQRIDAEGPLPLAEVLQILRDIVGTLAAAHERGVIHRDVKPDNVMLEGDRALLADFGIAKLQRSGARRLSMVGIPIGTPAYMAPEQVLGDLSIDHRADVYAVGVLAYELLTGLPPFARATSDLAMAAHLQDRPTDIRKLRPDLCQQVARVIMRCLKKDPSKRWQSMRALSAELEAGCSQQRRLKTLLSRGVQSVLRYAATITAVAVSG